MRQTLQKCTLGLVGGIHAHSKRRSARAAEAARALESAVFSPDGQELHILTKVPSMIEDLHGPEGLEK